MKKWLVVITYFTVMVSFVWAYTLIHTGPEIDQGVGIALDIGSTSGIIQSDGANNISSPDLVTVIVPPGSDTEIPTEKAVVDYHAANDRGEDNVGANAGAGAQVYQQKSGINLVFRSITGSGAITVTENPDTINIETAPSVGEANRGVMVGTGPAEVYGGMNGVNLQFKRFQSANSNLTITDDGSSITFNAATQVGTGEVNTASNVGAGVGLSNSKVGVDLPFKSLVEGNNIQLTPSTNEVRIDSESVDAANVGTGEATLFRDKTLNTGTPDVLNFKRLQAGANVTLTNNANEVIINSTGSGGGVAGPGSSTNQAIATWNGTGGNLLNSTLPKIDGSGNIYDVEGLILNVKSTPGQIFRDSDMPGSNKEVMWITPDYVSGGVGSENSTFSIDVVRSGVQTPVFVFDSPSGRLTSDFNIQVPFDTYGAGWNGNPTVPTKNDVYDKVETIIGGGEVNTISTTTPGNADLVAAPSKVGADLRLKSLVEGPNINIAETVDQVTLSVPVASTVIQGVANFNSSDFNVTTGTVTNDYVNSQKATESQPGYLEAFANAGEVLAGTVDNKAIAPANLKYSEAARIDIGYNLVNPSTDVDTLGLVEVAYTVGFKADNTQLFQATCSVYTIGTGGSTGVQIVRRRAQTNINMLNTPLVITTAQFATSSDIDTGNDDLQQGDQILFEITGIHSTTAAQGLSCTLDLVEQ